VSLFIDLVHKNTHVGQAARQNQVEVCLRTETSRRLQSNVQWFGLKMTAAYRLVSSTSASQASDRVFIAFVTAHRRRNSVDASNWDRPKTRPITNDST